MSQFVHAKFMLSADAPDQFPADKGSEVAVAGRSNAGKSSAINVIVNRRQFARTSKTPGRTQLVNFFELRPADSRNRHRHQATALKALVRHKKITTDEAAFALQSAANENRDVGEALLRASNVTVEEWLDTFRAARDGRLTSGIAAGVWVVLALVIVAAAIAYLTWLR